ncbi:MAG TPA: hypothetical protein VHY32_06000 [Caulobacteraceae bacterium]|nr:hypothetical protein [Caulobacteraceae bacterium]
MLDDRPHGGGIVQRPIATSAGPSSGSKVRGVPQSAQKPLRARFELWKCLGPPRVHFRPGAETSGP